MSGAGRRLAYALAPLAAVLLLGALLAYFIAGEIPTGTVRGVVVMKENGRPLGGADVYLTPSGSYSAGSPTETRPPRRHAVTNEDGSFVIARVPVGGYKLSAVTSYHRTSDGKAEVREGATSNARLALGRTEPSLSLGTFQHVWATKEQPKVPVRGYVDPARDMRGDTLKVRVWRTHLSTMLRDPAAKTALEQLTGSGGHEERLKPMARALLHPASLSSADAPRLVSESETVIRSADREGFYHERLPVPAAGPGVYLIEVRHGKQAVSTSVLSTDMALIVKRTEGQVLAYAVGLSSGKPVTGATVRHWREGALVGQATTSAAGLAQITVPVRPRRHTDDEGETSDGGDESSHARLLTVAARGNDEAAIGKDAWFSAEDAGGFTVHAYTDRTVYRPGHTVRYKAIVRRKDASTPGRYTVPTGEPVTVEVRDPQGGRVVRESLQTNRWGTLDGSFELSPEAPTGTYSLICTVRGEKHTADVSVASYRKPDFAVTVTPAAKHVVQGDTVTAIVEARYYFGAPVAGAKVTYHVFRNPDWSRAYGDTSGGDSEDEESPPPGYSGEFYGETAADGEAILDENGRATITVPTERRKRADRQASGSAPSDNDDAVDVDYTYTLDATVEDQQAKRTVDANATVQVTAGSFTLAVAPEGYAATPGRPHSLVVRATDPDGKPVPKVEVTVTPAFERWAPKTGASRSEALPRVRGVTGPDGAALLTVTPPRAGSLRLTATAYDEKGRVLHARSELWVTGDDGADLQTEYADLALLTDKRRYEPGDTARILVNTARTGQTVLLTVEGDRIYRTISVPVTKRSTVVKLPVDGGWGPNVTVAACYVKDKKYASSEQQLRVRLTRKSLRVTVTPNRQKYRPGDTAAYTVKVTDAAGRPVRGELSLSVVDEAIYALRADDPRALWDTFYPRRYSRVQTDYSFEVTYLGDADKSEPQIEMRRKFLDTALWSPHVVTDASGTARVTVPLPDNLTTWRATALVCSPDTSVGRSTAKVVVTKPFFVRLDAPRFLTQTDEGRLLALLHNETDRPQTVHVKLTAPGLLAGEARETLTVKPGEIGQVPFPIKANTIGDVPVTLSAWTDANDERTGRPFTDGVEQTIPVRAWGRERFTAFAGVVEGSPLPPPPPLGGKGEPNPADGPALSASAPAPPSQAPPSLQGEGAGGGDSSRAFTLDPNVVLPETRLTVRVTPSVRAALAPALEYLVGFPYGCTEQTMSRFLPDVLVARVQRDTGQTLLTGDTGAKQAKRLPRMVRDGIARLRRFQHGETGAWGWWENDKDDPFMTGYVLYGLAEARAAGYVVPDAMWESALKGARELLGKAPVKGKEAERAFLLYALAEAGDPGVNDPLAVALDGTAVDNMEPDALAYLVLAARRAGADPTPAWNALQRKQVREGRLLHWTVAKNRYDASDRMATAAALRALLAMDPNDPRVTAALRWLMAARTDDYWGSTRDTAWVLAAFCDYLRAHPEDAAPAAGTLTVRVNGKEAARYDLAAEGEERELLARVPSSLLTTGRNTLEVTREGGSGTVFWTGGLREIVGAPRGGELAAFGAEGITVKREYLRVAPEKTGGDAWRLAATLASGNRFRQGDSVRVRLTVTAPRDVAYVLIEDRFPSNLEVTERGSAEEVVDEGGWSYWYSSVDVRDDRIAFFATSLTKGTHTVEYNLRAQTPGGCRALPAQMQAMYDPAVRAESADARVEVGR